MPGRHYWDNLVPNLYCIEVYDKWSWDDFSQAMNEAYKLLTPLPHRVDCILWFKGPAPRGNALPYLKRAGGTQPATIYRTVAVVEHSSFVQTLIQIIDKTFEWEGPAFAKSIEEARAILGQEDIA